jgi:hypothetical protein
MRLKKLSGKVLSRALGLGSRKAEGGGVKPGHCGSNGLQQASNMANLDQYVFAKPNLVN